MATSAGKILIMPKGAWDASTTYGYLDLVTYNGAKWLCKVESCTNVEPSPSATGYWYAWDDSNVGGSAVDFSEPSVRTALQSGDTVSTLFGKTKKYLSDLADVAFSGDFEDLDNVPDASTTTKGVVKVDGTTIKINSEGVISGAGGDAKDVDYDNQKSKLIATDVQNAIDETVTKIEGKGDTLTFDEENNWVCLRSGGETGTILSHVTIEGGATSIIHVQTTEPAWKGNQSVIVRIEDSEESFEGHFDASGDYYHKVHFADLHTITVIDTDGKEYVTTVDVTTIGAVYYTSLAREITLNLTVYSAAADNVNIYYKGVKSGSPDTVCVTNDNGVGTVSVTVPKNANVLFESTKAKDTTDGTSNYQKNVTLSDSTSEIYLMPDGAIYWDGNRVDCEAVTLANGWVYDPSYTLIEPNFQTQFVNLHPTTTSGQLKISGIASKTLKSLKGKTLCIRATTPNTPNKNIYLGTRTAKTAGATLKGGYVDANGIKKYPITEDNIYLIVLVFYTENVNLYEMWYE